MLSPRPFFRRGAIACAIVLTMFSAPSARAADPVLNVVADTVVTPTGFNFETGEFGTSINGHTYQQEALLTFNGYQYAAYWESGARPAIARRALPSGAWETIAFNDYTPGWSFANNTHNVATLGICPDDGTIHLSFDQHNTPLRIRRSAPGAATQPQSVAWSAALFGPTANQLVPGETIGSVTYPQLFATPQGKLQFCFRSGQSGNGDWHLYEYSAGAWTRVGMLFSRLGSYASHNSRCAYPNSFRYDDQGRLHVTWTWRESGSTLRGNHDLGYAYSDDFGRTWRDTAGSVIATLDGTADEANAISINTPGHVAHPIAYNRGMMNQSTQFVDHQRRVHTIMWRTPDSAPSGTTDKNAWRYHHYWRDTDGVWHERELPFWGRKPQLLLDAAGNLHVIHGRAENRDYAGNDPGAELAIATATEASGWTDWQVRTQFPGRLFHGEPLYDLARWQGEQVVSVYFQERPAVAGAPSPLRVIDFVPGLADPSAAPALAVSGNGVAIVAGAATPSVADHTHFGALHVVGGSVSRAFTLSNPGDATLVLGSVTIEGAHPADFAVTAQPAGLVAPGGSTTLGLAFDPAAEGARSAIVRIASNAPGSPFTFAVGGVGEGAARSPVADAHGRNGSYSTTNYGSSATLEVKLDATDFAREAFLRFDVSGLAGAESVSVVLVPLQMGSLGSTTRLSVELVPDDAWSETALTWANKPASTTVLDTVVGATVGQPLVIDVTAQARAEAAGDGLLSLRVRALDQHSQRNISFGSREHATAAHRPVLIWSMPPALTDLQSWRLEHFGTTEANGPAADDADPDGDGQSNLAEFLAGTDPTDASSAFRIVSVALAEGDVVVSFTSAADRHYHLLRSESLLPDSWSVVGDTLAGTGGLVHAVDTGAAALPRRFYRVRLAL